MRDDATHRLLRELHGDAVIFSNLTINSQGRSTSTCKGYYNGVLNPYGNYRLQFTLALTPSCVLTGRLHDLSNPPNGYFIKGRTDAQVNIVIGNLQRVGGFTMTRN